jgi:hypothetical protein
MLPLKLSGYEAPEMAKFLQKALLRGLAEDTRYKHQD